jgi:hypothetical protein
VSAAQRPTLPGKAEGVVGWDPLTLQCRACGATTTNDERDAEWNGRRRSNATFVILSGFHFHICEGREGKRMCPTCLARAKDGCGGRCSA